MVSVITYINALKVLSNCLCYTNSWLEFETCKWCEQDHITIDSQIEVNKMTTEKIPDKFALQKIQRACGNIAKLVLKHHPKQSLAATGQIWIGHVHRMLRQHPPQLLQLFLRLHGVRLARQESRVKGGCLLGWRRQILNAGGRWRCGHLTGRCSVISCPVAVRADADGLSAWLHTNYPNEWNMEE